MDEHKRDREAMTWPNQRLQRTRLERSSWQFIRSASRVAELGRSAIHHVRTLPINTRRLILRSYETRDLDDFIALNTDPEVRRHVGGVLTSGEAVSRFQTFLEGGVDAWAITLLDGGRYVGHAWLDIRDDPEIGFLLIRSVWRQGYGIETAQAVLDYALKQRGYPRVVATVDPDHSASIRVLERAGMQLEREERDEQGSYYVYAMQMA